MEKKPIRVKVFVDKYNSLSSNELKENMVKSLIYRNYVPILEKKLIFQRIFEESIVGERDNQYIDTFINETNITLTIIELYTNIYFKKEQTKNDNNFTDYDLLAQNDLFNIIFNHIPAFELDSIIKINEQLKETFYNKNQSTKAYIGELTEKFANRFGLITDASSKMLLEVLNDEKKMDNILKKLPDKKQFAKIITETISKLQED